MNRFSSREKAIIKVIGRRQLTIAEISEEVYKDDQFTKPLDPEITISNYIRRIIKKCEYYELNWTLYKKRKNNKLLIKKGRS